MSTMSMNKGNKPRMTKKTVGTNGGSSKVAGKKPALPKRAYGTKVSSNHLNTSVHSGKY